MFPNIRSVRELARIGEAELVRRQRIAESQRGKPKSEAQRRAIAQGVSRALLGKPKTEAQRQAISRGMMRRWAARRAAIPISEPIPTGMARA